MGILVVGWVSVKGPSVEKGASVRKGPSVDKGLEGIGIVVVIVIVC